MNPGDVFQLTGGELVTVESVVPGKDRDGLKTFDLVVITPDGTKGRLNLKASQELDFMPNRRGNLPTPEPAPEPTPDVPERPTPKPKNVKETRNPYSERASMDTFLERARQQGREDDGQNIAPSEKSREELFNTKVRPTIDPATGKALRIQVGEDEQGRPKYKTVQNPDAVMQQLLDDYPEAKINERGEIIVERNRFTDSDGAEYDYEIAVAKTYGNGFLEKYKFTSVETGEEKEFYHYDYKDSYSSLHGKTNGIVTFRDQILGREIPGGNLTDEKARYFGPGNNLDQRIKFFRGKANNANLNNPNMKLLTQQELIKKYLDGRAQKLNMSINPETGLPLLTQLQEELPSFWDAAETGDKAARIARIVSVLGRLPDNQLARAEMVRTLRAEISERYNGTELGRPMSTLANNLERAIKSGRFDINNLGRVPYSAKDGNTRIQPGMRVRYTNNEGDESVGIVSALNPNTGPNEYHDTVRVKFEDGKEVNILATKYMDVVDNDTPLSEYIGRVEGDELRERRAERFNIDLASYNDIFDPDEGPDGSSDNPGPDGPEPEDIPPIGDFGDSGATPATPDETADVTPTETATSIKPGRVTVDDSQLANSQVGKSKSFYNRSRELDDFLGSDSVENENFIRVDSGSRKELAAIKPTPAATELKNNLVSDAQPVVNRIFNTPEYENLRSKYIEVLDKHNADREEIKERYSNASDTLDQARDNLENAKIDYVENLRNLDAPEESIEKIRLGNFEDAPELNTAAEEVFEAKARVREIQEEDNKLFRQFIANDESALQELNSYRHNAIKTELENQGVEFGGITTQQLVDEGRLIFNGPRNINKPGITNSPSVQRQYQEQFDEILSFIPRNAIESIFSNNKPLKVGVGTTRGNYKPSKNSMVLNVSKRDDGSRSIFDVGIHELWHAAQSNNADIAALEHAWTFDRARGTGYLGSDGVPGPDRFPSASSISGYGSSERFIKFNAPAPVDYTQKTYNDGEVLFNSQNSEVLTTLMQGLFSNKKYIGLDYKTGEYDEDAIAFAIGVLIGSSR